MVVGGCICSWKFTSDSAAAREAHASATHDDRPGRAATDKAWGFIQYEATDIWQFPEPIAASEVCRDVHAAGVGLEFFQNLKDCRTTPGDVSVRARVEDWEGAASIVLQFPFYTLLSFFTQPMPFIVRSVLLSLRTVGLGIIVTGYPPLASIKRWRTDYGVQRSGEGGSRAKGPGPIQAWEDTLLELPRKRQRIGMAQPANAPRLLSRQSAVDPNNMLNAFFFLSLPQVAAFLFACDERCARLRPLERRRWAPRRLQR